ncbi:lysylphosphatidylglycerol synthase transmembrane domain-containing protein [Blastococcus sp. VKM Ac-2987]|uniref:lysylphosphatidylglycerol synthase transmembrane domain-containing protein n=1 Tax=Blastococcus sp. VKM Ac-2987 TaxID=3004141 RepID=UPI0022AB8E59|nr:lysylphosphatidylglycerol synthase transmembrane domain-containing protein [Blastococcus sp. VKM Ac-2987]MCZ2860609.1 lysylphosphatidylglycerol synthase transmembrane domain-containing protein [Blastococcus sp. VKM Ac-2987]
MNVVQLDRPRSDRARVVLTSRGARTLLTVAVVVAVFAGVLPRIADYGEAWALVRSLTWGESAAIAVLAVVNVLSYAPLWVAAVPGLRLWRAVLADQASTAIANTVPVGFAFGVGTTAAMYHSFGIAPAAIARAVTLTGVWNNLVKLAMPAVALGGLVLVHDTTPALTAAAALGSGLLVLAITALVLALTSRRAAAALAGAAQRIAGRALRRWGRRAPTGWVVQTEGFRQASLDLVRHRWPQLTAAALVSHTALFVLLLGCLRAVDGQGADASWLAVLAVFSVTRLVTMVPITPGALGVAELSYVAGLVAIGVDGAAAAGTVLVFRLLTWFLPIPLGALAWVLWRRGAGRVLPGAARG